MEGQQLVLVAVVEVLVEVKQLLVVLVVEVMVDVERK